MMMVIASVTLVAVGIGFMNKFINSAIENQIGDNSHQIEMPNGNGGGGNQEGGGGTTNPDGGGGNTETTHTSTFRFTPDATNNTFTIYGSETDPITIYWGDGVIEKDVKTKVTHTYTDFSEEIVLDVDGKIHFMAVNKNLTYVSLGENNITNMIDMFEDCTSLTTIPKLDTSMATGMSGMFRNCKSLTQIPLLDTSNVDKMFYMFANCESLTTIPKLDTSKVNNMSYMFWFCTSLTMIPQLDTSNVTKMSSMFTGCESLTTIPLLDTSNVTNMMAMFQNCSSLTTIPLLDTSNVTDMSSIFAFCNSLTDINLTNINTKIDVSDCKLEQTTLHKIIDNLVAQSGTTKTLTVGSTLKAKISQEYIQKATEKGWIIE